MKIETVDIICGGFFECKSAFYSAHQMVDSVGYSFHVGVNELRGEVDSGTWAVSYLLSMYKRKTNDIIFSDEPKIAVNGMAVSIEEIQKYSCYMDREYALFSGRRTVEDMVKSGLKRTGKKETALAVRERFGITEYRFGRPLRQVGNERYKAMAAIGYSYGKQIFCFPWMSQKRFDYYHLNLTYLLEVLEKMEMVVVLPVGNDM